jgi:preprotein translocase subunit YajC
VDKTGETGNDATGGDTVDQDPDQRNSQEMRERFAAMSRGKKIVLIVFIIWAIQAIPKWTAAIVADGETSAAIMTFFITPR